MNATNQTVVQALRGFYDQNIQALNGIMEKLPETLKGEFLALKNSLNAQLQKLPPLDQVPAAQDAAWALNCFADSIVRMQDYATSMMERLNSLQKSLGEKTVAYQGLEKQITDGEYLAKDKVKEATDIARADGRKEMLPAIRSLRTQQIELAKLPVPGNEILDLPDADFTAQFNEAKANVAALAQRGLALGGKGATWVKDSAWQRTTEFAGTLTRLEEIGIKATATGADPLLGRKTETETPGDPPAKPGRRIVLA